MKLLLDEMFSPDIAAALRRKKHDVESVKGNSGLEGKPDADILQHARDEQRAVLTNNVSDFSRLHNAAVAPGNPGHYGIVFQPSGARRRTSDIGRIVTALDAVLNQYPGTDSLRNGTHWL